MQVLFAVVRGAPADLELHEEVASALTLMVTGHA